MDSTADIQVTRTETTTVFEAVALGIRTAEVIQQDGAWITRCYLGPDERLSEAPRQSRAKAEAAALQHMLQLLRRSAG